MGLWRGLGPGHSLDDAVGGGTGASPTHRVNTVIECFKIMLKQLPQDLVVVSSYKEQPQNVVGVSTALLQGGLWQHLLIPGH